jgi:NitT/TauT family transport system ATP-binding protein
MASNEDSGGHRPTASAPKIAISHLTRQFRTRHQLVTAVDDISLEIATGTFFMIVGPSGCGKTTLLRILAGLDTPTSGEVTITRSHPDKPGNSMVFQGDSIFPWMTVYDNAAYGLRLRRRPPAEIRDVVGHFLDRTGLTRFARAYPHQLSGGMKQRVSIARAFANDPEILLMDEPFSALDDQNRTLLHEELLRIWDETKKTVIFITHSVDEAVSLGDRILLMTAQPGRAKALIEVPFERPRQVLALRADPRYGELVFAIWSQLRGEVERERVSDARVIRA